MSRITAIALYDEKGHHINVERAHTRGDHK